MRHKYLLFFLVAVCCLLLPLPVASADAFDDKVRGLTEITNVRISDTEDKVRIVVDADMPVKIKKMVLSAPDRVVVDIQNAWLARKAKKDQRFTSPFISRLQVAQFDEQTVRVVVHTKVGSHNYSVFTLAEGPVPGRVVLDFGNLGPDTSGARIDFPGSGGTDKPTSTGPPQQEPDKPEDIPSGEEKPSADSKKPEHKPDKDAVRISQTPSGSVFQPADKKSGGELDELTSLKGRKITIDPGHGGNDSGAIGPTGVMEKAVTLQVALELKRLLTEEGATVYMTRTKDTEVSPRRSKASDVEELQARCDVANTEDTDIFISIHMDSFSNKEAKGTTGYYYKAGSAKSRQLADKVRQGVIDQLGTTSRGTQTCAFYVVHHTEMPATLVELAFISNPNEERLLNSKVGVMKAAQGIADGIADYFG